MPFQKTIVQLAVLVSLSGLWSCGQKEADSSELTGSDQISYNFHIRPILSDKCFACHGPDANKREADLRLDTEEGAFKGLKESPGMFALVAGKPAESALYHRIISEDPGELMPPPDSNLKLTPEEISLLKKWIEQGAKYEPHWAFLKVEKPAVPETEWGTNEIDAFAYKKMRSKKLEPNPEAKPHELIKRASLDLTGLPPTPATLDKYGDFSGENTYEKLLDELLAQPAYGEKLGVLWMDISRYADSYGYQDDEVRSQWPYRLGDPRFQQQPSL